MKNEAEHAVHNKIKGVEGEQGAAKSVGSEPPQNFGHSSAKSAGVGNQIPVGDGNPGGGSKNMDY